MKHRLAVLLCFLLVAVSGINANQSKKMAHVDLVVAQDGSGDYTTLQAAINAAPDNSSKRFVIFIKDGKYDKEKLIIPQSKKNLTLKGESRAKTIVSYHMYNGKSPESDNKCPAKSWALWKNNAELIRTSATLTIMADGCQVENLTLENTAGPVGQALALTVCGDREIFRNCNILGYQDTIYLWTSKKRSYFDNCLILGRTDYIYGGGIGYFESCEIRSWGGGWITAPSTSKEQKYGFVFNKCNFTYIDNSPRQGDNGKPIAIGRPWHEYPKVAILNSTMCEQMHPEGWPTIWRMEYASTSKDLHLYEYNNKGKGADMSKRAKWAGLKELTDKEAQEYTREKVLGDMLSDNIAATYKDRSLSPEKRAELLVKELTLEEKVLLMMDGSKAIERLGIKPYNWWNEALHGVARAGLATVFPQPIGMAASFSPSTVYDVFTAVSDEARAKNAYYASQGSFERYQGLTMWTPTVNIYRDPRWGRGIETYGEDPYLTSRMGVMAVKGLQGSNDGKYDKLHACAKHFAVHSGPEWNRHSFDAKDIKPRDLFETYLPAFEALVKEGDVKEVMCAYNRFEGEPCCGSNRLLMQILREDWGFKGIVLSDCGAIADFYNDRGHRTHSNEESASAAAVLSGTDLECGSSYKGLVEGVKKGLISEEAVNVSVKRLLAARFALGEMDDPAEVSWTKTPFSVVASDAHAALALDIARKSMTLLMNKGKILPLKRDGLTIAVMGPNANDSVMQWGNYNGMPLRTVTILDGIRNKLGANDKLIYEQGCAWVERTLIQSAFSQCKSEKGAGFSARYWNNVTRQGAPVTTAQVTTPFHFCTSGATVFAPGVNLTDFSATYNSVFTPEQSGEIVFEIYSYGSGRLRVNGAEVKNFSNKHGGRTTTYALNVEAGKSYDIELDFEYLRSDAQLNFDLGFKKEVDIMKSVELVKDADIVIFAGGISPTLEGEEMGVNLPGFKKGDRTDIELPAVQRELINALRRAGKKVILVNCSGSPIGLEPETKTCEAILQAWYPGQAGGTAVAEVLFGDYNPSGKLPVTFYRNVSQLPDFEDYNMAGRTYRYMNEAPLFPFGYGLSYTAFKYGRMTLTKEKMKVDESLKLIVPVTNTGKRDGEEVVQVYLKKQGDVEGPNKTLRAFKRVKISSGETVNVEFELSGKTLEWWDSQSNAMRVCPGRYDVMVGSSSKKEDLLQRSLTIE